MNPYLRFERDPHAPAERKTETWNVRALRDGALLGQIRWFGRWRQYAFFPEPGTVYNPDCLDSINGRIRSLMRGRREGRAA